jgi:hypothetical protein
MKKHLNTLFKLASIVILSLLLSNESSFAHVAYTEVLETEIEEEDKFDMVSNDASEEVKFIGDDGSKKTGYDIEIRENNRRVFHEINIETPSEFLFGDHSPHVPNYILFCSLIVYS